MNVLVAIIVTAAAMQAGWYLFYSGYKETTEEAHKISIDKYIRGAYDEGWQVGWDQGSYGNGWKDGWKAGRMAEENKGHTIPDLVKQGSN